MARARDPNREKAYEIWKRHNGEITNRAIAEQLSIDEKKVAVWKQRDKWNVVQQTKKNVVQQKDNKKKKRQEIINTEITEDEELTERQRLFCLYYVKTFNATQSAIKAGYAAESAHVEGSRLLRNAKITPYIRKVKQDMTGDLFVEAQDVLRKWIKIAFADITDFLTFGRKEITQVDPETGEEHSYEVNFVEFKESNMVDGTIISEVKQGKDGISVKLADKMKALEKLSLYFDLFPDQFKQKVEEEKLQLAKEKLEIERDKKNPNIAGEQVIFVDDMKDDGDGETN